MNVDDSKEDKKMKCPNDKQEMSPAEVELRDEIGGRSYVATVHGWRCAACGEEVFEGERPAPVRAGSRARSVDGLAFRVLGMIGADRLEGRSTTQDTLWAARTPTPSSGEVRITVG